MRPAISILLTFVLILQVLSRQLIVVGYLLHKTQYMEACVNKSRPIMKCEGKCLLKKELNQAAENEQKETKRLAVEESPVTCDSFFASACMVPPLTISERIFPSNEYFLWVEHLYDIFHPPQVS